jgi:hypothetical protein
MKSNSELSEYQKRIENIDNVILCVAEAEHMVKEAGKSLIADLEMKTKSAARMPKGPKFSWGACRTAP